MLQIIAWHRENGQFYSTRKLHLEGGFISKNLWQNSYIVYLVWIYYEEFIVNMNAFIKPLCYFYNLHRVWLDAWLGKGYFAMVHFYLFKGWKSELIRLTKNQISAMLYKPKEDLVHGCHLCWKGPPVYQDWFEISQPIRLLASDYDNRRLNKSNTSYNELSLNCNSITVLLNRKKNISPS